MFFKVDPGSSVENAKKRQFYKNSTNRRTILKNNLLVTYETVTVRLKAKERSKNISIGCLMINLIFKMKHQ